jgi:hypothetical protein
MNLPLYGLKWDCGKFSIGAGRGALKLEKLCFVVNSTLILVKKGIPQNGPEVGVLHNVEAFVKRYPVQGETKWYHPQNICLALVGHV